MKKLILVLMMVMLSTSVFAYNHYYDSNAYVGITKKDCVNFANNYYNLVTDLTNAGFYDGAMESDDGYDYIMAIFKKYGFSDGDALDKFQTMIILCQILDYDYYIYENSIENEDDQAAELRATVSEKDYDVVLDNYEILLPLIR